ncbi:MAG: hypothetical protein ACRD47_09085 [Nitrososphaeraceae archaeon]
MSNNNTGKHASMGEEQGRKTQQGEEQKVESKWAQIVSQVMEKVVSGTNMSTTIEFDNLEVDVPKAKGPDGRDLGGATWKLNGKVVWITEAHKDQGSI